MDLITIGKNIKTKRKEKKLTQKQFAEKVGLSTVFICQIETGTRKPSFASIIKIAHELNVSIDFLIKPIDKKVE